ncbi:unnamed protein product [Diatraea saccharalis]|uniref:Transmembrane protein n=1 Tax=Diatraea saccharalis TaxID=40085 RepID=A0A9P0G1I7_9NEOP|nr:unnamed protein product [Diatraea saccharalis]
MNLKLNNELQETQRILSLNHPVSSVKEERRRTGRYIAILVGISLFLLAMYHAWVRRIPIVASLVVPALIMFVYVAWVLYTASKDKHRLLDAEAALCAAAEAADCDTQSNNQSNIEISVISSKDSSKFNSPDSSIHKDWTEIGPVSKEDTRKINVDNRILTPLILINDKLPEDLDQKWSHMVAWNNNDKIRLFPARKMHKRKFCRRKHEVFKRSYSIA